MYRIFRRCKFKFCIHFDSSRVLPTTLQPGNIRSPQQPLTILAIDTEATEGDPESGLLGTDFMFFTAFLGEILFIIFCKSL